MITFSNTSVDEQGTGFGTILNVLSLQQQGNNTTEAGSVLWDGTQKVLSGDAANGSETPEVTQLSTALINGTNFGLILNLNEGGTGASLVVDDFELVFQDSAGGTLFTAVYDAPAGGLPLQQIGSGQGAAGWLFNVSGFTATELQFFNDPNNRLGQRTINGFVFSDVNSGADNFYVAAVLSPTGTQVVPEPMSIATWAGLGIVGAFVARRRRKLTA